MVVVEVRDPLDQRVVDGLLRVLATEDASVFVLWIDSPGMSSGDPGPLFDAVAASPVPVVVWVGPGEAVAHGAPAELLQVAHLGTAAPGARVGYLEPTVVRGDASPPDPRGDRAPAVVESTRRQLATTEVVVDEPIPGYVDEVVPTVGQLVVNLDGRRFTVAGSEDVVVETAETRETDAGTVLVPSVEVRFLKADLYDRFLRLAARPETAFLFLVVGLAAAVFEFYAAGVGVTAAVAVLALFLAGYGMATLPVRPLAVSAVVVGSWLYVWEFQRGTLGWRSVLGTAALLYGGLAFTTARPQFGPSPVMVVAVVVGAALFYGFALTTIVRSRFSTRTIGREGLLGRLGVAETDLTPDGVVVVDGARWRARAPRTAAIRRGDEVAVVAVEGIVLQVEPARG